MQQDHAYLAMLLEGVFGCAIVLCDSSALACGVLRVAVWLHHPYQDLIMQCVEHSAGTLIDLLYNLLRFDPAQRLTARDALKHAFFREPSRRML